MEFIAKPFEELSTTELYEILKSRSEVFMLEQGIICQDMDDVDYRSLHCFYCDGGRVVAYLRAFRSDEAEDAFVIGRVLTLEHNNGMGSKLMNDTVALLKEDYKGKKISLHAQTQAIGFYEKCGFVIVSDEFMEEGVPHVTMELCFLL